MKGRWRRVAGARTPTKQPIRCHHTPEPANRNSQRGKAAPRIQRVVRAQASTSTQLKIAGVSFLQWYLVFSGSVFDARVQRPLTIIDKKNDDDNKTLKKNTQSRSKNCINEEVKLLFLNSVIR